MVTVIGLGFVGLTTALGFAELGNQVCGQEVSAQRRNMLQSGKIDFQEEMLPELLQKHLGHSFLLGPSLGEAVASSELVFLCVGTPCQNDGAVDLTQLTTAVKEIMAVLPDDGMISFGRQAVIVYDPRQRAFYAQPGDSHELCYVNDQVVLGTVPLNSGDVIEIGSSKLSLLPLCGEQFGWDEVEKP